ncbi:MULTISPECIES: MFS transporter [unclassified Microbacterium]|uniref:MFS transporter n=1 Tax=unclassified Microbacterium TaxID=2609290 RepID=UPI000CFD7B48|nr:MULTISPECIES: MFS transporter [unclassified Microbacterium]PQZ61220.1 MFS transporter [Microbacterium sp. MYb43]PQZ82432.1 MFS transporter [Microbacterium sp. MYb40]PRB23870.1 MFS transporter [Microbacterium sp. MYb54]PRB29765.1 MFS transporter [Microbacterium sp. MYb50]PRB70878.1 MFS transporter [Microbacterium sp. MYb24]
MTDVALTAAQQTAVQRRTVLVLSFGQVLGGIAFGATVSLGALLAADISGNDALSGLATASVTLGAAACAIPLARLAARVGRRRALTLGNLFALVGIAVVILAASLRVFPLLLAGILMIGAGNAGNLQSRFAATDLAAPQHRGRDLSIVVWSTTIGGVAGPLLLGPGEIVGQAVGMPPQTGSYLFSFVAQCVALVLYIVALRPDPLLAAQRLAKAAAAATGVSQADRPRVARYAIFAIAGSHVVMASVMAMTPVHLSHMAHGAGGMAATPADVSALVGITIALHVGGMYALSPVFGVLADRWGRLRVVLLGQVLLAGALAFAVFTGTEAWGVMVALILLGLGWSAATVAGAALLTEASAPELRTRRQGRSDSLMSLSAAAGSVLAGVVLSNFQYSGLGIAAFVLVVAIVALSPLARSGAR